MTGWPLGLPAGTPLAGAMVSILGHPEFTPSVYRVGLSGGAVSLILNGTDGNGGVALDTSNVYWIDVGAYNVNTGQLFPNTGGLYKQALPGAVDGGTSTELVAGVNGLASVVVSGADLYYLNPASGSCTTSCAGAVVKLPVAGGTPTTIASGLVLPAFLAENSTHPFWANRLSATTSGSLMSAPQ